VTAVRYIPQATAEATIQRLASRLTDALEELEKLRGKLTDASKADLVTALKAVDRCIDKGQYEMARSLTKSALAQKELTDG
jgi:hypothetical protein